MSRFVGTSLLLLALIGKRCQLSLLLLPDLSVLKGFGSCQEEYNFNDSCIKVQWKMEARITYLMVSE